MTDKKALEKKIKILEKKVKMLEEDREWMEAVYKKAKELVIKHRDASELFIGRKLIIDFKRVERILKRLEEEGVIGPARGIEPREILVK